MTSKSNVRLVIFLKSSFILCIYFLVYVVKFKFFRIIQGEAEKMTNFEMATIQHQWGGYMSGRYYFRRGFSVFFDIFVIFQVKQLCYGRKNIVCLPTTLT